jgi:hypothetical protein
VKYLLFIEDKILIDTGLTHFNEKDSGIGVLGERTLAQHPNSRPIPGELRNTYDK